jgi:WD40 repeat protein
LEDKEKTVKFQAHNKKINAMSFSNSGARIVTASDDKRITLWDRENIFNFKNYLGHTDKVNSVFFSPDDQFIVSSSSDKTIKIWDVKTGDLIKTLGGNPDPVLVSILSHDNKYIASLTQNNTVKLWNAETGRIIDNFEISGPANSIYFTQDNNGLMIVSSGGEVKIISIRTGKEMIRVSKDFKDPSSFRTFSADGKHIVSILWDGNIQLWDYEGGEKTILTREDAGIITAAALSPDRTYIAAGFMDGRISVSNVTGPETASFVLHKSRIESIQFSLDGKYIVSGSRDGTVRLWDPASGKEIVPAMEHSFRVSSASFSKDGMYIITGSYDNTTRLWDARTGKEIAKFISFAGGEWIVITPDGYYNASPRGDEYLTVQNNGGIYGMDQFSAVFEQSDVVSARLQRRHDMVPQSGALILIPPAVGIRFSTESASGRAEIAVSINDRFYPVRDIQIVVNGRLLGSEELSLFTGSKNLVAEGARLVVTEAVNELNFTIPVNLEPGSNNIQVIAANDKTEGRKRVYIYNTLETSVPLPDLWVLAVGSNSYLYGDPENDLKYSVNNAEGIKKLFEAQQGKRYRNVQTRILADGRENTPTRINILSSINEYFSRAKANDVLVLYLSGHGEDGASGQYYFLPQDVRFAPDGSPDYSQAISIDDLGVLLTMPGRKIVFIDSCFSGGVDNGKLTRSLKNQSTAIFTSSRKNERSWEGISAVEYGFFTESLISGMYGEASVNNEVKIIRLGDYVSNRVSMLTGGIQHPYIYIPEGFFNFVIAEIQ